VGSSEVWKFNLSAPGFRRSDLNTRDGNCPRRKSRPWAVAKMKSFGSGYYKEANSSLNIESMAGTAQPDPNGIAHLAVRFVNELL
jgi:hypothetical protein